MSLEMRAALKENVTDNSPTASAHLSKKWVRVARSAWIALALIGMGFLITSLPGYALKMSGELPGHGPSATTVLYLITQTIGSMASLTAAAVSIWLATFLFRRQFDNPAAMAISFYMLIYGVVMAGVMEVWGAYWLGNSEFVLIWQGILLGTPTIALMALFPNGRMVPHWMRWVILASIPYNIVFFYISPDSFTFSDVSTTIIVFVIWIIILPILGIYAQIYRYRKVSNADERHQTKWVIYGLALWIGYIVFSSVPFIYITNLPADAAKPWWWQISEIGWWVSLCILPISFTIAITRSKLWNIDIVINRTLVYGGLTVLTMGIYIFLVGTLGNMLQAIDPSLIAFLATGLIAVLFQPLRNWIQQAVNRMMYGDRDDPVAVLSKLGERIELTSSPEDALTGIVETVARTLKLPYTAIELGKQIRSYGIQSTEVIRLPLIYQKETTGFLVVSQRSAGEAFSSADLKLLENISHQAGAAAHAVKLTAELRYSRQKLVATREEERRRLRRDLHDGLGPTLASLTMKLDTARNLLRDDQEQVKKLIEESISQTQQTIQDIRTLVYDLRPPVLDDFGLIGAIQNFIEIRVPSLPRFSLELEGELPALPAATEVAIYRIALEGITNILRHANANSAVIRLSSENHDIILDIIDDGFGLPDNLSLGVGLTSIRERCDELGGWYEFLTQDKGVHIRVSLPCLEE
jgi:signal transduction histidine kinase